MATSSIFTEVKLKDKTRLRKLVNALERSQSSNSPQVNMSRHCSDMTPEQMKKIFGENDGRIQDCET